MVIHYMEKEEYKAEPIYNGNYPIGFNVFNSVKQTRTKFDTLAQAEYYIKDNVKTWG